MSQLIHFSLQGHAHPTLHAFPCTLSHAPYTLVPHHSLDQGAGGVANDVKKYLLLSSSLYDDTSITKIAEGPPPTPPTLPRNHHLSPHTLAHLHPIHTSLHTYSTPSLRDAMISLRSYPLPTHPPTPYSHIFTHSPHPSHSQGRDDLPGRRVRWRKGLPLHGRRRRWRDRHGAWQPRGQRLCGLPRHHTGMRATEMRRICMQKGRAEGVSRLVLFPIPSSRFRLNFSGICTTHLPLPLPAPPPRW